MGPVRRAFGIGQAAARQRPASVARLPRHLVSARLVGPGFDIRGATSPGSPGVVLGHNGTIGWGFTTTNLDSQDLFVERVDPTDPAATSRRTARARSRVREETINVLWGDPVRCACAAPVTAW